MDSVSGIGVLDKAISVLDSLEGGALSLGELVAATGLPRATAYRLAVALEVHGFVARDGDGRFALGPRLTGLDLAERARPALERLRDATGESVQLYVRRGDRRLCVASLESPHGLRTIVAVGASLPLDAGSAGKVLRGDPSVAKNGWAQSVEEREKGVASVSAPVAGSGGTSGDTSGETSGGTSGETSGGGEPLAAVSVSGPIERTTRNPGRRYAKAVMKAAAEISAALTP